MIAQTTRNDTPVERGAKNGGGAIRIAHVITGLSVGGAETMLLRLIPALGADIESSVICLSDGGPLVERIRALGTHVEVLALPSGLGALLGLPRVVKAIRRLRPNLVHTWLYHADLLGGLAAKRCGVPVIWGLHNSTLDPSRLGYSTVLLIRLLAGLSRVIPRRIVSCSEVGLRAHVAGGYDGTRMLVIPNGFDTGEFRPDPALRVEARRAWGVSENQIAVGLVARFNPLKDHHTFLSAAGLALQSEPRLRFVLYGDNVTPENARLIAWASEAHALEACRFLGPEQAVNLRLPGLDLLVSSSTSEAFPLILGEAMACGVRCVTTDVGDSAAIIQDESRVVPAGNARALADAILRAVRLDSQQQEQQILSGIESIQARFSLSRIGARFRELYLHSLDKPLT